MFHKRRHVNGQQVYEKVLNIIVFKGAVNQNHGDYHVTPVRCLLPKQKKNTPKYNKC